MTSNPFRQPKSKSGVPGVLHRGVVVDRRGPRTQEPHAPATITVAASSTCLHQRPVTSSANQYDGSKPRGTVPWIDIPETSNSNSFYSRNEDDPIDAEARPSSSTGVHNVVLPTIGSPVSMDSSTIGEGPGPTEMMVERPIVAPPDHGTSIDIGKSKLVGTLEKWAPEVVIEQERVITEKKALQERHKSKRLPPAHIKLRNWRENVSTASAPALFDCRRILPPPQFGFLKEEHGRRQRLSSAPAFAPFAMSMEVRERFGITGRVGIEEKERLHDYLAPTQSSPSHLNDIGATNSPLLRESRCAWAKGVAERAQRLKWRQPGLTTLVGNSSMFEDAHDSSQAGGIYRAFGLTTDSVKEGQNLDQAKSNNLEVTATEEALPAASLGASPVNAGLRESLSAVTTGSVGHILFGEKPEVGHVVGTSPQQSTLTAPKQTSKMIDNGARSIQNQPEGVQQELEPIQSDIRDIFIPCASPGCPVEACLWSQEEKRAYCVACWPLLPFHEDLSVFVNPSIIARAGVVAYPAPGMEKRSANLARPASSVSDRLSREGGSRSGTSIATKPKSPPRGGMMAVSASTHSLSKIHQIPTAVKPLVEQLSMTGPTGPAPEAAPFMLECPEVAQHSRPFFENVRRGFTPQKPFNFDDWTLGDDKALMTEFTGSKQFTVHPATKRAQARIKRKKKAMKRAALLKQKADKVTLQKERERRNRSRQSSELDESQEDKILGGGAAQPHFQRTLLQTTTKTVEAPLGEGIRKDVVPREVKRFGLRSVYVTSKDPKSNSTTTEDAEKDHAR